MQWNLEQEFYPKALKEVKKAYEYYIDDILVLYKMALLEINAGEIVEACEHLSKIQSLAIDQPYPYEVDPNTVVSLIEKYCVIKE